MSGCVFLFLHIAAVMFFPVALFVTIPLHIIAGKE